MNCFFCEDPIEQNENDIQITIYRRLPATSIYFHRQCFKDMRDLLLTHFKRNEKNISNCSICKQTILVREWTANIESVHPKVFVDIFIDCYYRICKSCFDRDIGITDETI